MKVLHLLDTPHLAGTERHILTLTQTLRSFFGVNTAVVCRRGSLFDQAAHEAGIETLPLFTGKNVLTHFSRLMSRPAREAEIFHCHNGRTLLSATLLPRNRRPHVVYTQHFLDPGFQSHSGPLRMLYRWGHRTANARVSHFIAVSEEAKKRMVEREGVSPDRITVVPNGIAPEIDRVRDPAAVRRELGVPEDSPFVICVSRLEKEKDISTLVLAMARVRSLLPSAKCIIAGDGSQRASLEMMTHQQGLSDVVRFTGFVPDALSAIGAANLLVLPSIAEPFGLVLLEAMALGRAVVATDAGGPREIVVNGETGLLVPPQDPAALAKAIVELLSEPDRAAAMGERGRTRFLEHYTAERMARNTLQVYRRVLEEG